MIDITIIIKNQISSNAVIKPVTKGEISVHQEGILLTPKQYNKVFKHIKKIQTTLVTKEISDKLIGQINDRLVNSHLEL